MSSPIPADGPPLDLTTAVAQRRVLESLATIAQTTNGWGLVEVLGSLSTVTDLCEEAGDARMTALWKSLTDLVWTVQIDYRRSNPIEGID